MRSPLVQQWAGILAIAVGLCLFSVRVALVAFGVLVLIGGVGRGLDARRPRSGG